MSSCKWFEPFNCEPCNCEYVFYFYFLQTILDTIDLLPVTKFSSKLFCDSTAFFLDEKAFKWVVSPKFSSTLLRCELKRDFRLRSYVLERFYGEVVLEKRNSTAEKRKRHQTNKNVGSLRWPRIPLQTTRQRGLPTVMRKGVSTQATWERSL